MLYNFAFRIFLFLHIILNSFHRACVHVKSLQSCPTLCNPMDCNLPDSSAYEEFSRQGYLSGLPFPHPGDLPYPWMEPVSPAVVGRSLPLAPPRKFSFHFSSIKINVIIVKMNKKFKFFNQKIVVQRDVSPLTVSQQCWMQKL